MNLFEALAPLWILIVFLILSILIPGLLIWFGLKLIGKNRSVTRCGVANFAALTLSAVVSFFLHFTPLVIFLPLIAFIVYFYTLKTLLDVGFIEAFAATLIAGIVVFLVAVVILILFGIWLLFTPSPSQIMHMGGVRF
ncbi:MAG: hypothetical protein QXK44_04900 [Archaeoglobaceae archaeon]